jgi:hypothetical protein
MWEVFNPWTGDTVYTLPAWIPDRIVNVIVTLFSPDLDYAREGESI